MPCYDGQSAYLEELERKARLEDPIGFAKQDFIRVLDSLVTLANVNKKRADTITDMLCRVMGYLQATVDMNMSTLADLSFLDQDIQDWWKEHKKFDKERLK